MRRPAPTAAIPLITALLVLWPAPLHPTDRLLGAPDLEAVDHLWTLWLALRDGPLVLETTRVAFPGGFTWVMGDPLSLLFYAPGEWLGGPALGFHLVQLGWLLVAGLGAAVAGRTWLRPAPPAWLSATLGVLAAPMAGGLFTGMTEAQPMGLPVLALAAWAALCRAPSPAATLLAAGLSGATVWAGPYGALYLGMGLPIVLLAELRRPRALAAALVAAGLALLLAAPVLQAILTLRPAEAPGARSLLPQILAAPADPKNQMLGADLLHLVLPLARAGDARFHVVYLGLPALLFAALGRRGAARSHTLLIGLFAVLSLGFYLVVAGRIPRVYGRPLLLPAGLLAELHPLFGQSPRYYRAAMVAALLLSPLAASGLLRLAGRAGARAPLALAALIGLVAIDSLFVAPLPWPRQTLEYSVPAPLLALVDEAPLLELPRPRANAWKAQSSGDAAAIRHPALLYQTAHGHPMGANPYTASQGPTDRPAADALADHLVEAAERGDGAAVRALRGEARALGFGWLVHLEGGRDPRLSLTLRQALGAPGQEGGGALVWPVTD